MKVLDLRCEAGHTFEGWFASEDDFVSQCERALVQCPVCGDAHVHKKLSAPRLNLSGALPPRLPDTAPATSASGSPAVEAAQLPAASTELQLALQQAWERIAKTVLANTVDVGDRFAEEARRIHYGEAENRGIRGRTTLTEARDLVEEGIDLMPLALPEHLKGPLQ
ncbi:DUF1178 family protein [Rhodoferax sp. OV413]|uniref:DUF1178 family protein n=1 Tax=Rhodoferax sp. OV413 TaxID=1855285 RepID=UPI0025F95406|nr:DUF1178 family protein [Rhodoferax sp. OV413]